MGIRLVESVRLSCSGANPRWDICTMHSSVQFDGEFFAVSSSSAPCQPDGVQPALDWSSLSSAELDGLHGWFGPTRLELLPDLSDLACDGYIAEPAA